MNSRQQKGITTVEFAIIATMAMLVMLSVLEMGRLLFVLNTLGEATRRGARVAAVCPINDPAVAQVAVFNTSGGGDSSPILHNFSTSNIQLEYLDVAGTPIDATDPTNFTLIRFVRVGIANFQHNMLIFAPFDASFALPASASTLPRESLGVPRTGPITPC